MKVKSSQIRPFPFVLLLLMATFLYAQPDTLWSRIYEQGPGQEYCYSAAQTDDEGIALFGWASTVDRSGEFFLVRTDADGEEIWGRNYGGERMEMGYAVAKAGEGFLIVGYTASFAEHLSDGYAIKVDPDGEIIWSHSYDSGTSEEFKSVITVPDNGFAFAGTAGGYWLVRIDDDGEEMWSQSYGGTRCYKIIQTSDAGFALAGHSSAGGPGSSNFYFVKTDENGRQEWTQSYGGDSTEWCNDLIQTLDGGYALAGMTGSFGAGEMDFYLVKTDEEGEELWSRTYGGRQNDNCYSVYQTKDGGYVLGGSTLTHHDDSYGNMLYIVRVDSEGEELWDMTLGTGNEVCKEIMPTPDGGYVFAGNVGINRNGSEYWLVKTGMDVLIWLTLPDTGFYQDSILAYDMDYFYDYISPGIEIDTLLVFDIEDGEHVFGEIEDNQLIITSENDWLGLDSLRLIVAEAENEDNCDSIWLRINLSENNDITTPFDLNPPLAFTLYDAYPNPFNSSTTIRFDLAISSNVSITLTDLTGRRIATLLEDRLTPGQHKINWDAKDYSTGVYLCRMEVGGFRKVRKMVLVR